MPEEISIDMENGIIFVKSWGHISTGDPASSRDKIFEIYDQKGLNKAVIEGGGAVIISQEHRLI
jgi:hypothetical protein